MRLEEFFLKEEREKNKRQNALVGEFDEHHVFLLFPLKSWFLFPPPHAHPCREHPARRVRQAFIPNTRAPCREHLARSVHQADADVAAVLVEVSHGGDGRGGSKRRSR